MNFLPNVCTAAAAQKFLSAATRVPCNASARSDGAASFQKGQVALNQVICRRHLTTASASGGAGFRSGEGGSNVKIVCAAAAASLGFSLLHRRLLGGDRVARSCGIIGYIGNRNAEAVLVEGVRVLQNRGYDSCGISTVDKEGNICTTKYASKGSTSDCIERLAAEAPKVHGGHSVGIGHTRWATHGAKTDRNAHPHSDWKDRISLIHNGTIENYFQLKERLINEGIPFQSETDTEVISNLIGLYLEDMPFEKAVERAVGDLRGTWGLVVLHKDYPDRLVLARNGSPLLVGGTEKEVFIASEPLALAKHTNEFLPLMEGEIVVVSPNGIENLMVTRQLQPIAEKRVESSPYPFPNWTIKEIFEQPQSLSRALNHGGRISPVEQIIKLGGLDTQFATLRQIDDMILSGCGTSLNAALYGELLMQYVGSFSTVRCLDASELDPHSFPKNHAHAGIIFLSQSGETRDVIRACQLSDSLGVKKLSVVNVVGSQLARMTNCGVYLNAGREVGVCSTKAFTSQVAVLSLIAAWFAQNKGSEYLDRMKTLTSSVLQLPTYSGIVLQTHTQCREVAEKIKGARSLFVLGKGMAHPVALEGALKIKEVSYTHAEGFAGGALKHGPFALIDAEENTPVILMIFSDEHSALMINAAEQVKARGAHVICITDDESLVKHIADDTIVVPNNGPLTALLATIPLQMIGYSMAIAKGIDPDKPRGLAKTVTVS